MGFEPHRPPITLGDVLSVILVVALVVWMLWAFAQAGFDQQKKMTEQGHLYSSGRLAEVVLR